MPSRGRRLAAAGIVALHFAAHAPAQAAATAPTLGTAASFAVLGGTGVVNSGATRVSANVGVTPGTSLRGFPPGIVVLGDLFVDDATARQAHRDAAAAYDALTAQAGPGVYRVTSPLPTPLILTGGPNEVWIFQVSGNLETADDSSVLLRGGANYNNVFWQVDGAATLGACSTFAGTIIARGDVTLKRDASMNGRALSLSGVVTLDTDDVSCCDPIEFTPPSLPDGTVGQPYSPTAIAPSGGVAPYAISVFDGALPPGLALAANGSLSGTPATEGVYRFTLLAVDAHGCSSIHCYSVTVCDTIVIVFDPKPNPKACAPFTRKIEVKGGVPPYTITVKGLPDGLSLAGDAIGGTATAPGCTTITITVTDSLGCTTTITYVLCVDCGLALPPLSPSTATACVRYRADVTPSCGKAPFVFTAIGLPSWLLPPPGNGILTGMPPAPETSHFSVTVVDANGCADTASYTLVVAPGNIPLLPTIELRRGIVCTPYDSGPLAGTLVAPASLPPGLVFDGSLHGDPTQSGRYCFSLKIPNPPPCTSDIQEYCVTIECPALALKFPLDPMPACVPTSQSLAPPFCIPFSCSYTGTLPAGLTFPNCVLQGTPQPGDYDFTVTATAGGCTASQRYTGTIPPCQLTCDNGAIAMITPPSSNLPNGTVGIFYSQMFIATGGTMPYTFTVPVPPSPPPGITLSTSGTLSGVPTTPGRFNFAVRATDANGACHSEVYTIVIGPHPPAPPDIPALSPWAMLLLAMALAVVGVIRRWS